ncbi:hypothetical protein CES86_5653 [Brucella lupini]|uniref:Uncharacterized protein n=1 Tax=Brucella lupini TaxID=255457 RepID=A0A256H0I7_9HYPH|nr:hypothetical protein CES86_5653 [Brucella lupini]
MGLCESEIVRHVRAPSGSGPIPARWLQKGLIPGAITAQAQPSGRSSLADPSRVDRGRSGVGPGRHQERAGLVSIWSRNHIARSQARISAWLHSDRGGCRGSFIRSRVGRPFIELVDDIQFVSHICQNAL